MQNYTIYNKENGKILYTVSTNNINNIKLNKNESCTILKSNELKDNINFYKKDGSLKTLKEQLKDGLIKLKKNEYIDEEKNEIKTLNGQENELEIVKRGIQEIDINKKIDIDKDGKEFIREKTLEEKYKEKLITKEEFNIQQIENRKKSYKTEIDPLKAKLIYSYIKRLYESNLLNEEEKKSLEEIESFKKEIKNKYKKINL